MKLTAAWNRFWFESIPLERLAIFRILAHRRDSLAWATLLLLRRGVGSTFLSYIYDMAHAQRRPFGDVLLEAFLNSFAGGPRGSSEKAHSMIREALDWIEAQN